MAGSFGDVDGIPGRRAVFCERVRGIRSTSPKLRLSEKYEGRPVIGMRKCGFYFENRFAQSLRLGETGAQSLIEPAHQLCRRFVVHHPETDDEGWRSGSEESACEPQKLVASEDIVQAGLA